MSKLVPVEESNTSPDVFDFVFPSRFDEAQANDGRWFAVVDENDVQWGRFKCTLIDSTVPRYKIALERLQRKYGGKSAKAKPGDDFTAELFIEMSLVDWDMKNSKGDVIPFSRQAAMAYFTNPRGAYALKQLLVDAENVANFQPEEQEELPEGN